MLMSRETAPESDNDSLFGEGEGTTSDQPAGILSPARRRIPPNVKVEGLYFDPDVCLPESVALDLLENIKAKDYFRGGTVNQLMLFERSYDLVSSDGVGLSQAELAQSNLRGESAAVASSGEMASSSTTLPPFLVDLLSVLSDILRPHIPESTSDLLFPDTAGQSGRRKPARQAILNLYRPGEGITPHVDLLKRFGDGIIIVSLGSGTVMQLAPVASPPSGSSLNPEKESVDLWLEPRSILVLEKEARYGWTHGIPARKGDWVENDMMLSEDDDKAIWVERGVRVSITLRWLLPGAEIVGGADEDSEMSDHHHAQSASTM
ncbi:hypothetical protein M407DRAFT_143941 [Tulasnella calospora MUT 4182]|uniref:Fe2OG dioxygenase domain-containing protein n=1 Tax=Tulasnella calospora MUT 4182 TaxID=1051891 RepID=A0A0C3LAL1_9AGAM|nr:hypothetical protein M407DRAFT_143941 [Tulasnella calospora MUT 4182]